MRVPLADSQSPSLSSPVALLFDWDNTLIDSWLAIQDAQNHTLTAFGLEPWSLAETKQRVRGSMRDSYPALFGAQWQEAGTVFYKRFAERHLSNLRPLPGVEELLQHLLEQGVYVAVVSNKKGDYLREEVAFLGWERYFEQIVGAFDAERDKPWPDPVLLALSGSGLEPNPDIWFAGDADIDLQCAIASGCFPVLVRHEEPGEGEFSAFPPALHVDSCVTLCNLLRRL